MLVVCAAAVWAADREQLFVAPLYVEYLSSSPAQFANETQEVKRRIGEAAGVIVGFSTFLDMRFRSPELSKPIGPSEILETLRDIDRIVDRARSNKLPVHIAVASGFFHGHNSLRDAAIWADVRNAQWFSDGWIATPEEVGGADVTPRGAWITPSRYAQPLRNRIEESVRIIGERLAAAAEEFPETLRSISGDAEVELSFARNLDSEGRSRAGGRVLLADYSPFMVAEFRDWLRNRRYAGDHSPASDDDRDGHTFNQDFGQQFQTWQLRYYETSGPIPFRQYQALPEKLPRSGPYFVQDGFDAPRNAEPGKPFWKAWQEFRELVVSNYLRDYGTWITGGGRIPRSRFYTHQIPADYLFGAKSVARLETSASPLETAFISPIGSAGVTVFDLYDGKTHSRTSNPDLFRRLEWSGPHCGIIVYSLSVPPDSVENSYLKELRAMNKFRPAIIAPFAWTNDPQHQQYRVQDTAFERALRKFVQEIGNTRSTKSTN
jgi:hypothetical protein